jgi:hypothetical protein
MMARCRGGQPVDRLGRNEQCSVESKSRIRHAQIVVNRLREADNVHAQARKITRDVLRTVSTDHHQGLIPCRRALSRHSVE